MNRIDKEKQVLTVMINMYCKKKHHTKSLCPDCQNLKEYVNDRLDNCFYQNNKRFCANCNRYCYQGKERDQIREVMNYTKYRILLTHPILVIDHIVSTIKYGKKE